MQEHFFSHDVTNSIGWKNYFSCKHFTNGFFSDDSVLTFVSLLHFNRVDLVYHNKKYFLFYNFNFISIIDDDLIFSFMISCINAFHLNYIVHIEEYSISNHLYDDCFNYELLRKEIIKYEQLCR